MPDSDDRQPISWDDLRLFAAIMRAGTLAGAAAETGVSTATLSRRMTGLEHALGQRLFARGANAYAPTDAAMALARRTGAMEEAAAGIATMVGQDAVPSVRISAGDWTMRLLLTRLGDYWSNGAGWMPDFIGTNARVDIARREADIGIRNARPSEPWLAARQIGHVDYAVYRAAGVGDRALPLVRGGGGTETPAMRWTRENGNGLPGPAVSSPALGLPMVEAGLAQMVVPRFIGDGEPGLEAVGETIAELRSPQWLVSHHDERDHPPVRAALDAIGTFLERAT